jgi:3-oxoacyl-[acyl-carrier-protein] synthase-3
VRTARIVGLGAHLPERVVTNAEVGARIGVDDDWIVRRTGIRERRYAAEGERTSDLAVAAARAALEDAGTAAQDVDLVLVATMTPDEITPNVAPVVAHGLGIQAGALDLGAACTGWLSGLSIGAAQIETGRADTVLVIGADVLTRITDFDDKRTAALFGDGAGAVVLSPEGTGSIGEITLTSDGSMAETIVATYERPVMAMEGHTTFITAVKALTEGTHATVARAGLTLDDVDLFVYHQANGRILQSVREKLGIPVERIADYVAESGNTSAATIPIALTKLRRDGRLKPGAKIVFGAVGAGFTWGTGMIEWGMR